MAGKSASQAKEEQTIRILGRNLSSRPPSYLLADKYENAAEKL